MLVKQKIVFIELRMLSKKSQLRWGILKAHMFLVRILSTVAKLL